MCAQRMFSVGWGGGRKQDLWEVCLLRQRKGLAGWTLLSAFPFSAPRAGLSPLQAGNSSCLNKYYKTWAQAATWG